MTDEAVQAIGPADPVEAARGDLARAHKQLAERANDVFQATASFVGELVELLLDGIVVAQPGRTAELGRKGVDRLRSDLAETRSKLTVDSYRRLKDSFAWTYPQAEPAWAGDADRVPLYQGGKAMPWMIDDTVRALGASAAQLAAGAGYAISPTRLDETPSSGPARRRIPPTRVWETGADEAVERYVGPYAVPIRLIVALRGYSDARLQYFRRLRVLRRLDADRRERDARIDDEVMRQELLQPAAVLWSVAASTPPASAPTE